MTMNEKEDKMENEDKILIKCKLTMAEYLSKEDQKDLKSKEGLVIEEIYLIKSEVEEEYRDILKQSKVSYDSGLQRYIEALRVTLKSSLKE